MKKFIAILLLFFTLLSLSACHSTGTDSDKDQSNKKETNTNDQEKISNLYELSNVTLKYFIDNGLYPIQEELSDINNISGELVPNYINAIPANPNNSTIYYASLSRTGTKNAGSIIAVELENGGGNYQKGKAEDIWRDFKGKDATTIENQIEKGLCTICKTFDDGSEECAFKKGCGITDKNDMNIYIIIN